MKLFILTVFMLIFGLASCSFHDYSLIIENRHFETLRQIRIAGISVSELASGGRSGPHSISAGRHNFSARTASDLHIRANLNIPEGPGHTLTLIVNQSAQVVLE